MDQPVAQREALPSRERPQLACPHTVDWQEGLDTHPKGLQILHLAVRIHHCHQTLAGCPRGRTAHVVRRSFLHESAFARHLGKACFQTLLDPVLQWVVALPPTTPPRSKVEINPTALIVLIDGEVPWTSCLHGRW